MVLITGGAIFLVFYLQAFRYLAAFGLIALLPLLDPQRRYLSIRLHRLLRRGADETSGRPEISLNLCRGCYFLSIVLILLLVGVLMPLALFRASISVERRLAIKQAQLHLASALDQRLITTRERCENDQLGKQACDEFKNKSPESCQKGEFETISTMSKCSSPWCEIVLDPMFPADGKLPVCRHSSDQAAKELYSPRFQDLI